MHVHCTECMVCVRYVRVGVHAKVHSSTCATEKTKCKTRDLPTVFVRTSLDNWTCGPCHEHSITFHTNCRIDRRLCICFFFCAHFCSFSPIMKSLFRHFFSIFNWYFCFISILLQELKESFNYGLFCPPSNGKAGKFLDEERRLGDYPFNGPVGYLEVNHIHIFCILNVAKNVQHQHLLGYDRRREYPITHTHTHFVWSLSHHKAKYALLCWMPRIGFVYANASYRDYFHRYCNRNLPLPLHQKI